MKLLKRQLWHFLLLCVLLVILQFMAANRPRMLEGQFWALSTLEWLAMAIAIPIVHQCYVLVCWRAELHYHSLTKWLGKHAFSWYKLGFAILILLRPLVLIALAISNANTVSISNTFAYGSSILLLIFSLYLFYSVKKYFGMDRAFGIDHFYPERYRNAPMVRQGIFRYTSNGMYVFGFMALWIPGMLLKSEAALVAAGFNHLYIWVHYYCTELPDMQKIYGTKEVS